MLNNYISGGLLYSWNAIVQGEKNNKDGHSAERNSYGILILGSHETSSQVQIHTDKDG